MLRNPSLRFHLRTNLKTMLTVYAVVAIVYVSLTALFAVSFGGEASGVSIGGAGFATTICLLVVGTTVVNEDLQLLAAFGVSRKSQFRWAVTAMGITVLAVGVFETVVALLLSLVLPYTSLFAQVENLVLHFGQFSLGASMQASMENYMRLDAQLLSVLWYAGLYALSFAIGFFFASFFKLIPRKYKPFAIVGVVVFFVWLLPYINGLTGNSIFRLLGALAGKTPLQHALFFAGGAVILLGIGYLFFRKLQLYTVRK